VAHTIRFWVLNEVIPTVAEKNTLNRKSIRWHCFYFVLQCQNMNNDFFILSGIIKNRQCLKPALYNGNKIPDQKIEQLPELADWATHSYFFRTVAFCGLSG
jgi:hypothetical protein